MSAQLLTDSRIGEVNAEQQELVKSINDDANRLLKITSELLNMSQVETGRIQLNIEPVAASEIVEKARESIQSVLQQKNIALKITIDPSMPFVLADREKTSWALINFITNAIKNSSEMSVIELAVKKIIIRSASASGIMELV